MPTIKEIIKALFNEIKAILGECLNEAEAALKKRLWKVNSDKIPVIKTAVEIQLARSMQMYFQ